MTLLHDFSHAVDSHSHHTSCEICRVLPQAAPVAFSTDLAVRKVAVFEFVREIQTANVARPLQISFAAAIPRGPPLLLLV